MMLPNTPPPSPLPFTREGVKSPSLGNGRGVGERETQYSRSRNWQSHILITQQNRQLKPTSHQSGFIQNLILPSLILLGAVVMGLGMMMEKNQRGLAIAESTTAAREQLSVIRDALSICRITWPAGNNGTLVPHVIYPATPGAALGAVPSDSTWGSVSTLVCPGANNGAGQNLWTAISYNIPQTPRGLTAWQYQNVAGGVYLKIDATEQDGEYVLKQVAQRLPAGEKTLTATSLKIQLMN